jgi:hypothetical protein
MAGNWLLLSGDPVYAVNMDQVTDVRFGDSFTGGKVVLFLTTAPEGQSAARSIGLNKDEDVASVKNWLDAQGSALGSPALRLGSAGMGQHVAFDTPDHLPQVLAQFVQAQPEAARVFYRLMLVTATRRWDADAPPAHTMDQVQAAIRDMHAAWECGDYAAALAYLRVWAGLLGADAGDAAPE